VEKSRTAINDGDKKLAPAWLKLEHEAQKALSEGPFTIINKGATPPSGSGLSRQVFQTVMAKVPQVNSAIAAGCLVLDNY
jgi:hypothetical protein